MDPKHRRRYRVTRPRERRGRRDPVPRRCARLRASHPGRGGWRRAPVSSRDV